jgi:hypothetical protein
MCTYTGIHDFEGAAGPAYSTVCVHYVRYATSMYYYILIEHLLGRLPGCVEYDIHFVGSSCSMF